MTKARSTMSSKPFFLVCMAASLALPLFYFDWVVVDIFLVSKEGQETGHGHVTEKTHLRPVTDAPPTLQESQMMAASGQHLLLDMIGGSFDKLNDEQYIRQATLNIVKETKMHLLGIQSHKLEPQGVSVVALLAESHLSIHTWPEHGSALIDLFTCGGGFNLQDHLDYVIEQYSGNVTASTYSVMPRGMAANPPQAEMEKQFQPAEIMTTHKYKRKVFEVQSPYQNVAVWDHHDTQEDDFEPNTMRSLFLDGVIQSNIFDEEKYHESLVHPAFTASSVPPKRVLIVGGGEGGTLRESLKYESVEKVVMVDLDAAVIDVSRKYLPSYSNCTGFGTDSCFDDPRLELYTEDFIKWFDKHIGNDICETANQKQDKLFDVIILDLLDTEALPEGEEWAAHLYSDLFFERISCALTRWGVVTTNFGEAPEGPFNSGSPKALQPHEQARLEMFNRKIDQIQTMSRFFHNTRVYDTSVPSYRANWAFACGMVPRRDGDSDDEDFEEELFSFANVGVNDFEGKPARVNLKLRRSLKPQAILRYYDGAVQHGFQYPTADWMGVYCVPGAFPEHKQICDLPKLFTTDFEDESFELRLTKSGGGASGLYAKKNIKKGYVTGLYDAATSIEIPATDYWRLRSFDREHDSAFNNMFQAFHRYGFDGGMSGGMGETIYMSISQQAFTNHACDHKPNLQGLEAYMPYTEEFWKTWNPVADRLRGEINHITFAARDISKGEMITDDYTRWDGLMHSKQDEWGHPQITEWCGKEDSEK